MGPIAWQQIRASSSAIFHRRSNPQATAQSSSAVSTMEPAAESLQGGLGAALGSPPSGDSEPDRAMRITLQMEATNLPNLDTRGKSDPFLVLYRRTDAPTSIDEWVRIGQTETVYNNLNPKWSTTFSIDYSFGSNSVLRFSIYDRDSKEDDLSKQDYIGEVRCTVAQIVLADNQLLVTQINNKRARPGAKTGTLTIRGEEEKGDLGDSVTLQFAASGLKKSRRPFYVLSRANRNDSQFSPVVYSEVLQVYSNGQVLNFKPTTKSLAKLVNGDLDRELNIQFMDYDRRGNHHYNGSARFTLKSARAALTNAQVAKFPLVKRKSNGALVESGVVHIKKCDISVPFSFLDYIRSGTVVNTIIAVDMSATNGNPADPSSLHYNNRHAPNEYVIALREVGNVLAAYDTTKTFPAFGFGAALPPSYQETSHCFALTGEITQPVCNGIEGVIEMYYTALDNVGPYEPCYYGPVISHAIEMTKADNGRSMGTVYTVLLLVTDGDFSDFENVANLICAAAELPLSIVIVGVGNSRFLQLERLDGDDEPLCSSDGRPCARDIVQFVPFHQHRYNPAQLAKEVLDEIPEQLVSYMRSKGIRPGDVTQSQPQRRPSRGQSSTSHGPFLPGSAVMRMNSSASGVGHAMPNIGTHSTAPNMQQYSIPGQQSPYPGMYEQTPTYAASYNQGGQHVQNQYQQPGVPPPPQQSYYGQQYPPQQ